MRVHSLGNLPIELVQRIILSIHDNESPSPRYLHHEPLSDLDLFDTHTLKNLSLTCRSLRGIALPYLFALAAITIKPEDISDEGNVEAFIQFLSENHPLRVSNVVIRFLLDTAPVDSRLLQDGYIEKLCSKLNNAIGPKSLTVLFPSALHSLLFSGQYGMAARDDGWAFDMPFHIIHLSLPHLRTDLRKGSLWDQPWSDVTLNEGSSTKVYSTYEYYTKQTPSIFRLRCFHSCVLPDLWSSTVRTFSYVAIFPMSGHIKGIFKRLKCLHNLQSLTTRLLPHDSSSILSDPARVGRCNLSDLWMEFEESYMMIATFVQSMGEDHKLVQFRPLDYAQPNILKMIDPILGSHIQNWECYGVTWTKTRASYPGKVLPS